MIKPTKSSTLFPRDTIGPIVQQTYFQKGFGLRSEIQPQLQEMYRSQLVDLMKANNFRLTVGDLTFLLATEFGFCYGVERAIDYAYETVAKFPGKRIFLTGEIIHNPHVNESLQRKGIRFLPPGCNKFDNISADDVVIVPAFGVPAADFELLRKKGCIVVDTTCGSVLNVWKNVERYARLGVTSIIHGKFEHEETQATSSRTTLFDSPRYLVLRDKTEGDYVCGYILSGGSRREFLDRFHKAASDGFDPDLHLQRIGLANQTTMLSSESLEIAEMLRQAMIQRYGEHEIHCRFHSFDTICTATQDRQDAIRELCQENLDLMVVIGGYNSSNTKNLTRIAAAFAPTFHIQDASAIVSSDEIRHKPIDSKEEVVTHGWFHAGVRSIGLTAGASTPNVQIGETVERILAFRGTIDIPIVLGVH
jgi:4-hydroxy-3-methylbut-2-enyl diphosphate reductase